MKLLSVLLPLALCSCQWLGIGTHYKYVTYNSDGSKKSEEVYHDYKDRNLGRIDLTQVPTEEPVELPTLPPNVMAEVARGERLMGVADTGERFDLTEVLVAIVQARGYFQSFASGALFMGMTEETSGQTAVLGEQINKFATRVGMTLIGYEMLRTVRHSDSTDLQRAKSAHKLDGFEAGQETKRRGIEAAKDVRLKEIDG